MANFNRVILAGNMTRDIKLSNLPSGAVVAESSLAINRKWKTDGGEQREDVCFVDFRVYGKGAETMAQYTGKGSSLLVEGRLKLDQWEDKEGNKKSRLYVVVDWFQFLGSKDKSRGESTRHDDAEPDEVPWS